MLTAPINGNTIAQIAIIAAPGAGRRIVVLGFFLSVAGAQTLKFQSASNDLMPAMTLGLGQSIAMGPYYDGIFDCNVNEALNMTLTAAQQTSGMILYTIRPG